MSKKILYVYAPAGPPLDYCFENRRARGSPYLYRQPAVGLQHGDPAPAQPCRA